MEYEQTITSDIYCQQLKRRKYTALVNSERQKIFAYVFLKIIDSIVRPIEIRVMKKALKVDDDLRQSIIFIKFMLTSLIKQKHPKIILPTEFFV